MWKCCVTCKSTQWVEGNRVGLGSGTYCTLCVRSPCGSLRRLYIQPLSDESMLWNSFKSESGSSAALSDCLLYVKLWNGLIITLLLCCSLLKQTKSYMDINKGQYDGSWSLRQDFSRDGQWQRAIKYILVCHHIHEVNIFNTVLSDGVTNYLCCYVTSWTVGTLLSDLKILLSG